MLLGAGMQQAGEVWRFLPITKLDSYSGVHVRAEPPICVAKAMPPPWPPGIVLTYDENPVPITKLASRTGFRLMTLPFLKRLAGKLQMKFDRGKRPNTEEQWVKALVKHLYPDTTDAQMREILAARGKKVSESVAANSILANDSTLECLRKCMDEDEYEDLVHAVCAATGRNFAEKKTKPETTPRAPTASSNQNQEPKIRIPVHEAWTHEEARSYLPETRPKTILRFDYSGQDRWEVTYPRSKNPYNCSKAFGSRTGLSCHEALMFVLKKVWEWHEEETKEPGSCPYEF